jgi:O-acetyl-ADP-ribose deacetylase
MKNVESTSGTSHPASNQGLNQQNNQVTESTHSINPSLLESAMRSEVDLIGGGRAIGYQEMAKPKMQGTNLQMQELTASNNYYEASKIGYQRKPYENDWAQKTFNIPFNKWSAYCDENLSTRRSHYRVNEYFDITALKSMNIPKVQLSAHKTAKTVAVYLVRQSLNQFEVDASVNPANETLLGGGGADQAIHEGAGPNLVKACSYLNGCEVGEAVITKGYDLPSKFVLHTVAPLLRNDGKSDVDALKQCYFSCFKLCDLNGLKSIVIPCIGCGFYGFDVTASAMLVHQCLSEYVEREGASLDHVVLSTYWDHEAEAYQKAFGI